MDIWDYLIIGVIAGGGIAIMLLQILQSRFSNVLMRDAFAKLGFAFSTTHHDFVDQFKLAFRPLINQVLFSGTFNKLKCWGIYFEINEGKDDQSAMETYLGIIIQTPSKHEALHIYDIRTQYKTEFLLPKKSESVEFDNAFRIYSKDKKSLFYELSPSHMKTLLDLRKKYPDPINIQTFEDKILIYSTTNKLIGRYQDITQVFRMLTQTPSEERVIKMADQIKLRFQEYYEYYKATGL